MTTRAYAEGTSVSVEKSKAEIDVLLGKHGASQRGIMADESSGRAMIAFVIAGRHYRLEVPLPTDARDPSKPSWVLKGHDCPRGWDSWGIDRRKQWVRTEIEQKSRERWRAVLLMLKAKLELVRIGVSSVEREFLADLVVNGKTIAQMIEGQIGEVLAGHTPRLLPQ